ncbi:MAG: hypothetical protein SFU20_04285 [Chitinophagaceae bacterium]|nr:hypothetical protein [Chitinophagaceae bacterium]
MMKQSSILRRKVLTGVLVIISAAAAYATLGDGGGKAKKSTLLANHYSKVTPGKFSLKSGYQYRGSQIISQKTQNNVISLNSVITYQKGNTTYIVPLKTNTNTGDKVKFSLGVPTLNK